MAVSTACGAGTVPSAPALTTTAPPAPPIQLPRSFKYTPGEVMRFEFKFRDVLVGRAALAVGEPGVVRGAPAIIVRSFIETAGVGKLIKVIRDDVITQLNTANGQTIEQSAEMLFGKRDFLFNTQFFGELVIVEFERRDKSAKAKATSKPNRKPTRKSPRPQTKTPTRKAARPIPRHHPQVKPISRTATAAANTPRPQSAKDANADLRARARQKRLTRAKARMRAKAKANAKARSRATSKPKRIRLHRTRHTLPPGEIGHDSHAVLGAVRAFVGKPGVQMYFYVASGRRIWFNKLEFKGYKDITTTMGVYSALRFDGSSERLDRRLRPDKRKKPRTYTMWISDDINRLPLLISGNTEYGKLALELVEYYKPRKY